MKKQILKPGRSLRHLIVVALAGGVLAACGDNWFAEGNAPTLNTFEASSTQVAEGETVVFTASASGPRTINRIRVQLSGAMTKDTTFDVGEPSASIVAELRLPIPYNTGPSNELIATATAIDAAAASDALSVSLTVTDETPPEVQAVSAPAESDPEREVAVTVTATDNRAVATVGVVVAFPDGTDDTLTYSFPEPAPEGVYEFTQRKPAIGAGELVLIPFAIDISGNRSRDGASTGVGGDDETGPTFLSLITTPDSTIPFEDPIQVQVTTRVMDPSGIRRVTFVGLSRRGNPSMGTDEVVERFTQKVIEFPRPTEGEGLPTSYTLNPILYSPDDSTTEHVEIWVVAEDALGNVSDTSKVVLVGGPGISITDPPRGFMVQVGRTISVSMNVFDPAGIDSVKLVMTTTSSVETFRLPVPPTNTVPFSVDTVVTMPTSEQYVQLQAYAWNANDIGGRSAPVVVDVLAEAPVDETAPTVSLTAERLVPTEAGNRMEVLDEVRVKVSALDGNSGLARIGLTVVAEFNETPDTIYLFEQATFTDTNQRESLVFSVPVDSLLTLLGVADVRAFEASLPANIDLRFHGFAVDAAGNRSCAVGVEGELECAEVAGTTPPYYVAASSAGLRMEIEVVRGVTVLLNDRSATIADLAVDTEASRLFLSNRSRNLVEFVELNANYRESTFYDAPVQVGSEPIGLFIGERVLGPGSTARTLYVANSGGTNVSLVDIDLQDAAAVQELDVIRLQTANTVLWQISESMDEFENVRFTGEFYDFSDRPQYLAQDRLHRIVYSTIPTEHAPMATVRYVDPDPHPDMPDDQPEVRFLITDDMVTPTQGTLALANVDSVDVDPVTGGNDLIKVFSHEPGYPDAVIESLWRSQVSDAVNDIIAQIDAAMAGRTNAAEARNYYPYFAAGTWDVAKFQWSDQTFVTASADGAKIALGEGEAVPTGRVMIWHASEPYVISDDVQIEDLQGNASEEVRGVGLNQNGTLGVARGQETTYFFDPNLRMTGLYRHAGSGGAGAAFHPDHDALTDGGHHDPGSGGVAFVGTAEHSIEVVNTFHFNLVNTLVIRDDIVGPLVAGPPLATDNGGLGGQCVALTTLDPQDCVVAKLYAITTAGGVVIVNVRLRDLEPVAP